MSKHFFLLLICCFLLTLSNSSFPFRQLIDNKIKDKVCKASDKDYETPEDITSLTSYIDDLKIENKGHDFIKNLLLEGNTDGLLDFVNQHIGYLLIFILGILLFTCNPFII